LAAKRNVIVVGVDGSPASNVALLWAAGEAERRKAGLHLVQAYDVSVGGVGASGMIPTALFDDARQWAETSLREARESVLQLHPELAVTEAAVLQTPFVALRDASQEALLTVVGSHGTGQISDALLGSIAVKVASSLRTPVVVVHTDPLALPGEWSATEGGPVLVGLDGSAESNAALAFAYAEASIRRAELWAVHSWDDEPLGGLLRMYAKEVDSAEIDEAQGRLLAEQLEGWSDQFPEVPVKQRVMRGRPSHALLRSCVDLHPSLLVVGSRGRGGFTGLLLGSTSNELIAYAPCPVAVVRGADE
jgi:nucleotide-binding universal stress UspA family protein